MRIYAVCRVSWRFGDSFQWLVHLLRCRVLQRFTYRSENSIRRGTPLVTLRYLAKGEPHRLACLFKLHARIRYIDHVRVNLSRPTDKLCAFLDMEHGLFLMTDFLCVSKCRQGYRHVDDNTEAKT